jgi:hypothetical protein
MDHNFYKDSISLEVATKKLRQGIAQGLYGPPIVSECSNLIQG